MCALQLTLLQILEKFNTIQRWLSLPGAASTADCSAAGTTGREGIAKESHEPEDKNHFLRSLQTLVSCRLDCVRLICSLGHGSITGSRECREVCQSHLEKLAELPTPKHRLIAKMLSEARSVDFFLLRMLLFEHHIHFLVPPMRSTASNCP